MQQDSELASRRHTKQRRLATRPLDALRREVENLKREFSEVYASVSIDKSGHPYTTIPYIYWRKHEQARSWEVAAKTIEGKHKSFGTFELWEFENAMKTSKEAKNELVCQIKNKYSGLLQSDEFIGLEYGDPKGAQNAEYGKVYWVPSFFKSMRPVRKVRGKTQWQTACRLCSKNAIPAGNGAAAEYCLSHGGGCAHNRFFSICISCNPNAVKMSNTCNVCAIRIDAKRREKNGGNGLCAACEKQQASEASASGSAPPDAGKRWEDLVLDQLIPKVVDSATGVPFPFEMRDSMSHMLGSSGKRRRGECDTTKQRRPDLLYLVREPERGRIVAALKVGVDEHSHETYEPECESGKIDDQFQALQQLAAKEGAAAGAAARFDAQMVYCAFLKFNPNACDVTPPIRLADRIEVLAKRCSEFLNTSAEEFQRRSREGEANVPHVECLYYHSVQGKAILEHFAAHAAGAWDWRGNASVAAKAET